MILMAIVNKDIAKEKSVIMVAVGGRTVTGTAYLGLTAIEERNNGSSIEYTIWMNYCI